MRRTVRLRTQVLLLHAALVTITLGAAFGVFAYTSGHRLSDEYGARALSIARAVAADPEVRRAVEQYARTDAAGTAAAPAQALLTGPVQAAAEAVRTRTDALFVVITDDRGIRLAHPDPAALGERVSTDPTAVLAGNEVVQQQRGTLGDSVRAKVPVVEPGSTAVVGEVSVGISTTAVRQELLRDVLGGVAAIGVVLALGLLGAIALARRWKRLTLGLEPEELADLVREQTAVLHGIGEGVVSVDPTGQVRAVNDEARTLLDLPSSSSGVALTPRLQSVVDDATGDPVLATVGNRVLVASARAVVRGGTDLGTVLTLRDRTDVDTLTRQLDAVQSMSSALRAQRHEFANRLHLISGLLHDGRGDQAADYIDEILGVGPRAETLAGLDSVADAYLSAFLAAKSAYARENSVRLVLGPNTWVRAAVTVPVDVTTVLGNLVDNAVDAARLGARRPAEVEVELVEENSTLHITVADTGDGFALDGETVFAEGVTTKPNTVPGGRGLGLALSRQIARSRGGDVLIASAGGVSSTDNPRGGAVVLARLPGALSAEPSPAVDTTPVPKKGQQ